jgi:hypothetical protein
MRKKISLCFLPLLALLFLSCETEMQYCAVSQEIRSDASAIAEKYLGMPYEWGGQSFWYEDNGSVDCSGLVINVYKEACADHGKQLPFDDTTAKMLHDQYTVPIDVPEEGDLIFMGNDGTVSHVALFRCFDNNQIEFLDAYSVDGIVEIRRYDRSDSRIISYGRILTK